MSDAQNQTDKVWLVGGATASGKSALALDLAKRLGGEIINADSMQVYRDLRILTARPSAADEAAAPHHLFGVADASDAWSVGRWLGAARHVLAGIAARGRPAIVVGGTGLYLRALTQGLADIPPIPAAARAKAQERFDLLGEAGFRRELAKLDPKAEARIAAGDRQRLTRALEVHVATDVALSDWQDAQTPVLSPSTWRAVVVDLPRDQLYHRCDARLAAMVEEGALEEVERLMGRELPPNLPVMKALGVGVLADHLAGRIDRSQAIARAQTQTRHYAKRQLTWFRTQTADWERISEPGAL